ncbi:Major cardiolipin synthase ClsA [compost metagenome]
MTAIRSTAPAIRVVPQAAKAAPARQAAAAPSKAERAVMTAPTAGNKVTLHVASTDSHQALLESIRTAKSSFYIETFIWHNDKTGNEIVDALAKRVALAKAKGETFDAKVMIDWFGLRQGTGGASDPEIINKLKAAGVEALEFAPGYINDGKLIPITHRKLYIQDGKQFITGGRNIGDEYLGATFQGATGTENAWHDLMFTVEGPETARIITEFMKNWKRSGGTVPAELPKTPSLPVGGASAKIQSFVTNPHEKKNDLQKAHLGLVANAEKEIVAIYPYFSDDKLVDALIAAKKKNPALTVKVMMPANKEAGREGQVYTMLNKETARQLMAAGIEVRMFAGGEVNRFSHFKGMVIDQKIVSIGSANGDERTMRSNHELNTVIADTATAKDFLKQVVTPDWAAATPVTQADLKADGIWMRIKQTVLEAFDFLL